MKCPSASNADIALLGRWHSVFVDVFCKSVKSVCRESWSFLILNSEERFPLSHT